MTPPCHSFPAPQLPQKVQADVNGRKRKTADGRNVDLKGCELLGLMQYSCSVDRPEVRDSPVRCWPVQRWFRRCQDKNGQFTVETTAWEGSGSSSATNPATGTASQTGESHIDHWTPSWQNAGNPPPRIEP
ncbi:hypothetical protein QBC33DRAFT_551490 [Phialemonium atrogriseum]|uniref:Uncharacterized protein n=1 Tax=Phialemonium atrogriseum TaxID=1093897 RepID=A0AAJ0FHV1_9PEZI|nr:uncharacterized protein QBC33DRAFT_551490 [Phialemonium atrogriseum]KAK1762584.1 hypothetical protein QBC33DRAFT_551490 [Phialemonium atrogriseum]